MKILIFFSKNYSIFQPNGHRSKIYLCFTPGGQKKLQPTFILTPMLWSPACAEENSRPVRTKLNSRICMTFCPPEMSTIFLLARDEKVLVLEMSFVSPIGQRTPSITSSYSRRRWRTVAKTSQIQSTKNSRHPRL